MADAVILLEAKKRRKESPMTLFEMIMQGVNTDVVVFTKDDWSNLGKGLIDDETIIQEMLAQGYEAIAEEED